MRWSYTKRTPTEADALASFPFVAEAALSMLRRHTSYSEATASYTEASAFAN